MKKVGYIVASLCLAEALYFLGYIFIGLSSIASYATANPDPATLVYISFAWGVLVSLGIAFLISRITATSKYILLWSIGIVVGLFLINTLPGYLNARYRCEHVYDDGAISMGNFNAVPHNDNCGFVNLVIHGGRYGGQSTGSISIPKPVLR